MRRHALGERVALEIVGVADVIDAGRWVAKARRLLTMPPTDMPPKPTP
jgi:hypothetical protein